jgi:hypothetical protein
VAKESIGDGERLVRIPLHEDAERLRVPLANPLDDEWLVERENVVVAISRHRPRNP